MKHVFQSRFKNFIKELIELKNSLGYSYVESTRILKNFDLFCMEQFENEKFLSKEIGLKWAQIRKHEKVSSLRNRIFPIRELAKYMISIGEDAYIIPINLTKKASRYVPHIYTSDELTTFFKEVDCIPYKRNFPIRHLVLPVIFRLIYCCGLRPSEARKLLTENIDLSDGSIKILESKGHKDRVVMLSDDMLKLCQIYYGKMQLIGPKSNYFFPDSKGNLYTKEWLIKTFRIIRDKCGLTAYCGNKPRIYDLRHTFATNTLYRWIKEGKDVNVQLPYLSAYLGHSSFEDTAYYIHLVPEFFSQMSELELNKFSSLIPEALYED